jgi:hypothetical protein
LATTGDYLITYELENRNLIDAYVTDISGRQITQLDFGIREPGQYQVVWNAGVYPEGIYLITLNSSTQTNSLKVVNIP